MPLLSVVMNQKCQITVKWVSLWCVTHCFRISLFSNLNPPIRLKFSLQQSYVIWRKSIIFLWWSIHRRFCVSTSHIPVFPWQTSRSHFMNLDPPQIVFAGKNKLKRITVVTSLLSKEVACDRISGGGMLIPLTKKVENQTGRFANL